MSALYIPKMKKLKIEQSIINQPWPIIIGLLIFGTTAGLVGHKLHLENESFEGQLAFYLSIILGGLTFIFAFSIKAEYTLTENGLHYRSSPFSKKQIHLPLSEIQSWVIIKHKLSQSRGLGYKRDFSGNKYIVMRWGKVLKIHLKKGKTLALGVNDSSKTNRFLNQNWDLKNRD